MGISEGGSPRVPVYNGTAADMVACTSMIAGDLWYTTNTKLLYTYDGAAWNNILAGVSSTWTNLSNTTLVADGTFDISGIASGYKQLKLILTFCNSTSDGQLGVINFNNDTGANYSWAYTMVNGAGAETGAAAAQAAIRAYHVGSNANLNNLLVANISNLSTGHKGYNATFSGKAGSGGIFNGIYASNTEINRIKITGIAGENLKAGSHLVILGCNL